MITTTLRKLTCMYQTFVGCSPECQLVTIAVCLHVVTFVVQKRKYHITTGEEDKQKVYNDLNNAQRSNP